MPLKITTSERRFSVKCKYDQFLVDYFQTINKRYFDFEKQIWSFEAVRPGAGRQPTELQSPSAASFPAPARFADDRQAAAQLKRKQAGGSSRAHTKAVAAPAAASAGAP